MDGFTIDTIFDSWKSLAESIKTNTEKLRKDTETLRKMDAFIESLYHLYPELKEKHLNAINSISDTANTDFTIIKFPTDESGREIVAGVPQWDVTLPFRTRIKNLLRSIGRYSKVSQLAVIAAKYEEEAFFNGETPESLQDKISRNLTAMKKQPSSGIELRKVHPGSSGYAWGFKDWRTGEIIKAEHAYVAEKIDTNGLFASG